MMRCVAAVVLFACHAEAVKLTTGTGDALAGAKQLVADSLKEEAAALEAHKEKCTISETELIATKDADKASMTVLAGANPVHLGVVAGAAPISGGQFDGVTPCGEATTGDNQAGNCGGQWGDDKMTLISCFATKGTEDTKAAAARAQIRELKWNIASSDTTSAGACSGSAPANDDTSICATKHRVEAKKTQLGTVAKECKKTSAIMEIAINIYSGKAMGSSFIQLAQEENIRADAKQFLESHSETERHSELLNMLHDFKAQMMRDCHQDLSEFKSDINALEKHMTSVQASVGSQTAAEDMAIRRANEAQQCMLRMTKDMNAKVAKAQADFDSYSSICGFTGASTSAQCAYNAGSRPNPDWTCTSAGDDDRNDSSCDTTLMWMQSTCATVTADKQAFIQQAENALAVMNSISLVQTSFIQVDAEQHAEALVQASTGSVDFTHIISIIKEGITNELKKQKQDANTVNEFADDCAKMLEPLVIQETVDINAVGTCEIEASPPVPCGDPSLLYTSFTCMSCQIDNQCAQLQSQLATQKAEVAQLETDETNEHRQLERTATLFNQMSARRAEDAAQWNTVKEAAVSFVSTIMNTFDAIDSENAFCASWQGQTPTWELYSVTADVSHCDTEASAGWESVAGAMFSMVESKIAGAKAQETIENSAKSAWDHASSEHSKAWFEGEIQEYNSAAECPGGDQSIWCDLQATRAALVQKVADKQASETMLFEKCTSVDSTRAQAQKAEEDKRQQCTIGVTQDLQEELHSMQDALQILTAASSKITGNAR